ncbi:MAG: hypothetical protein R3E51_00565 [Rhizobiaceae bacterium]
MAVTTVARNTVQPVIISLQYQHVSYKMDVPLGFAALTVFGKWLVDENPNTVSNTVKWSRFGAIGRDRR